MKTLNLFGIRPREEDGVTADGVTAEGVSAERVEHIETDAKAAGFPRKNALCTKMTTRQDILNQIRSLTDRLSHAPAFDPEFTPKELVRWNPTLVGTMLHCKHPCRIKRSLFGPVHGLSEECELEQFGVLTQDGLFVPDDFYHTERLRYNYRNTFECMTYIPVYSAVDLSHIQSQLHGVDCTGLQQTSNCYGIKSYATGTIPLVDDMINILDAIYVSEYKKFPFHDKEIIVDKYPLARIYEAWKQKKELRLLQQTAVTATAVAPAATTDSTADVSQEPIDSLSYKGFE